MILYSEKGKKPPEIGLFRTIDNYDDAKPPDIGFFPGAGSDHSTYIIRHWMAT